ncbi:inactive protein kinase SELMODRAFT_444075-like [Cornus florida]|uniref:inactive protein kinase SELMODRAFT_444075-like n=1 Tax=Cornus florida TaxID=4283 RepID=UPI00289C79ED|nr:inactive protein kinase SELMODRAFT_444075-like [Cornus florida]
MMGEEVIVVAVDASKEITDYALEWAVLNVIKAMDSLVLLAVLPSRERPPLAAGNQSHQSQIYHFLSRLLKKRSVGHNEQGSTLDQKTGPVDGHDVPQRINNVCLQMMQQLFLVHNVEEVITEVKVVVDAQMGSVAKAAEELGATWVILDRRLKKEGDCCLKELINCNIILIDHAIPKILRSVEFPTKKKINVGDRTSDPTVADMLGVLPTNNLSSKSRTTRTSSSSGSPHSKPDNSFFSTQTDQDQFFHKTSPSVTKFKPNSASPLSNSRFFSPEMETEAMYRYTPPHGKSQPLYKMSKSDVESPQKSTFSASKEETKTFSSHLKTKSGKIETDMNRDSSVEVRKTASIPARRSTDSPRLGQKGRHLNESRQRITRRELASSGKDEVVTYPSSPTSCSIKEKTKNLSSPLKTKSGKIERDMSRNSSVEVRKTASIPARRSTDSSRLWQEPRHLNESRQRIKMRGELVSGSEDEVVTYSSSPTIDRTSSIRKAMSLSIKQPPTPPPLCSVCKHNAPIFGKAPRRFSYEEIEKATDGFSRNNFLAEGGFGPVYRGVLHDGQVVAVKQHKMVSAQGASEFCSEVEALSCAQHRNLVMLVGYCIEIQWLLVYEFACNGSLDKHLYGRETSEVMAWHNRMKVAIGAARGLRYLHEDCRVGCIVHRDFRPTNILLTHDFESMVGDFGLARWQADGQSAEETRVIGSFGYLSPEYTQTGLITEKADVYAFGIVLLELITGIKATEFSRNGGQHYQPEWSRQLLEKKKPNEIIDPRLENNYVEDEVQCMIHAASLCILPHPEQRPRMSKVLRILEGDSPASYLVNHQNGQSTTSVYDPKQDLKGCKTEGPWKKKLDKSSSSYMMQSIHHTNISPSRKDSHIKSEKKSTFKQTKASKEYYRMASGSGGDLYQPEMFVNEESQEYLQGTLSEFIQNLISK